MLIKKQKKVDAMGFYVPFQRRDEENRVVEGYAFVNEVVPGEGGYRLKRSAMEAATADYMQFGNIREMHRRDSAVGKAIEAIWDEKGLMLRAEIVDDAAWKKVQKGVYNGFSVGVAAVLIRGKDVDAVRHIETSLVDRPKDKDALFTTFRGEGYELEDTEIETEISDEEFQRMETTISDLQSEQEKLIERATQLESEVQTLQAEKTEAIQRAETAESRIQELENVSRTKPPVRFFEGIERVFAQATEEENQAIETNREEFERVCGELESMSAEDPNRTDRLARMMTLKKELQLQGVKI